MVKQTLQIVFSAPSLAYTITHCQEGSLAQFSVILIQYFLLITVACGTPVKIRMVIFAVLAVQIELLVVVIPALQSQLSHNVFTCGWVLLHLLLLLQLLLLF